MNNILKDIRKTISNPSEQQKKFFKDACDTLNNHDSTDKIACFPAMPGIGKSTFIKAYIKQCAENCVGLVVLTDRWDLIETFRGCQLEYLSAIAILEKDTLVKDMISEIERKPVIIMTTQRFFALDEKYRKMLFVYQYRWFGQYRRNIIIDECPIFHQTMNINLEAFQIARSNVYASLDESVGDRYEINHMLMESEKCFAKFIETIDKNTKKILISLFSLMN